MTQSSRRYLYRSRQGIIFGVLRGLASYLGLSLFWLRTITIIVCILTGFFPLIPLYLVAALLMKPEPQQPLAGEDEEFYNSYATNKTAATDRLQTRLETLERRAARLESVVTGKEYSWDRRLSGSQ